MFHSVGQRAGVKKQTTSNPSTAGEQPAWASVITRPSQLKVDVVLVLAVVLLLVIGLLMVYSASTDPSWWVYKGDSFHVIRRQVLFAAAGIVAAVAMAIFDYHYWKRLAVFAMGGAIVLLVMVLFIGEERQGAVRTLFGSSGQPSELAKLVLVIYLAVWLVSKRDQLHKLSFGLLPLIAILGLVGGFIYLQPDYSAALTVILIGGLMFFLAGGELKQIAILLTGSILAGLLVVQATKTGNARVASYLAGLQNPLNASLHVRRALESFANGGWFGLGIGNGVTKVTGLPVPHTDSIFAVIGEELGVFGAVLVLALFTIILWRGIAIARRAPDEFGALLAAGLTYWLAFEAYINMAVMLNLVPFAGNALPFISAGGSNMVISMTAIGILLNISRRSIVTQEENERLFSAVADMRWWNRRRRVSRSHRASSSDK